MSNPQLLTSVAVVGCLSERNYSVDKYSHVPICLIRLEDTMRLLPRRTHRVAVPVTLGELSHLLSESGSLEIQGGTKHDVILDSLVSVGLAPFAPSPYPWKPRRRDLFPLEVYRSFEV